MSGIFKVCGIIFVLAFYYVCLSSAANELARGFNEKINWVKLDEGEEMSKAQNLPMMLLIHKSWCGACKGLKPRFAASKEIEELSKSFVMVNTLDEEEPEDAKFAPDGGYIPRILFRNPQGDILTDILNEGGNEKYKYYYHDPEDIILSMRRCLEKLRETKVGTDEL